ncbi:hypothetical protein QR680_000642 [Steinernema hermaphroditum]|uniref:Uncharacterized protein n=1 Tax=Steinernema hermaphroditum TaxID=289476 RepID=A0AA39GVB8_9BILA|nr:hypothetical protein QR680_000642 [Steinernema hermaphroditum]
MKSAFVLIALVGLALAQSTDKIQGTHCAPNQVINKITVYDDGAIEAECGPMPCGSAGQRCTEEQASCKADNDIFSGMKWARNGQSLHLRCCSYNVDKKVYVGTDLVAPGEYYTGGHVSKKDYYGSSGAEYDFISNIRTEQGGVRVWVHRIMCPLKGAVSASHNAEFSVDAQPTITDGRDFAFQKRREYLLRQMANRDAETESVAREEVAPVNPLQYRPNRRRMHDAPVPASARLL